MVFSELAYNLFSGNNLEKGKIGKQIGQGREGTVYEYTDNVEPEKMLVIKLYDGIGLKKVKLEKVEQRVKRAQEMQNFLRQEGLPVTPELRLDKARLGLIMTDLSERGKKDVVASGDHDRQYGTLEISNLGSIGEQIAEVYKKFRELNIKVKVSKRRGVIQRDVYFLVVDKETGNGKIILGDFGSLYVDDSEEEFDSAYESLRSFIDKINKFLKEPSHVLEENLEAAKKDNK